MRRSFAALARQPYGPGWRRVAQRSPSLRHPLLSWEFGAERSDHQQQAPRLLTHFFAETAALKVRIVTAGGKNFPIFNEINGWRAAVPGATPSLPANVGERRSNTVFASVCSFGVDFVPEAASPSLTTVVLQSAENPMKQGVAQRWPGLRHPPPRRHPFGSAHFGPCKMPRLSGPKQGDPDVASRIDAKPEG